MSECVTCGGPRFPMLPQSRERDECGACDRGVSPTNTFACYVTFSCGSCGVAYRGEKFAEQCCTTDLERKED